ncbi:hypothetical protein [Nocardia salmonicida]|uniref:hypothetical protein n=1 Tax=Nocardia salmonicida TaxID=53431 RepID=UPI0037B01137
MTVPVFTTNRKTSHPLSRYLWRLVEKSGLPSRVESIDSVAQIDQLVLEASDIVAAIRPVPPNLTGAGRPGSVQDGEWRPIPDQPGVRESTQRYWVAIEVHGDIHLLEHWPDTSGADLTAVDADAQLVPEPQEPEQMKDWIRRRREAEDTWIIGLHSEVSPVWALYTHVDLTRSEESEFRAGSRDLTSVISPRIDQIKPIVAAVATQVTEFFDSELPSWLEDALNKRRERLADRDAVIASLDFPQNWSIPAPRLENDDKEETISHFEPSTVTAEQLTLPPGRPRLARASFEDIQRTIRAWADAVERHPRAYHQLVEDRISDLLAATLNATLPGAHREVYTRRGKSDILIQADALATGSGPEHIFICETKWADSNVVVTDAHPQLFGYLTAHDTSAVLVLLMKQKDFAGAVRNRLDSLRRIDGFLDEEQGPAGWQVLHYVTEGRTVQLCIATIAVPQDYPADKPT